MTKGVLIDNLLLVDEGHFREAEMRARAGVAATGRRAIRIATSPT